MSTIPETTYEVKGQKIKISNAGPDDAKELLNYMKQVFSETEFLLREPGEFEMTVKEEEEFLEKMNQSENNLFILARVDGRIVGSLGFTGSELNRYSHQGEFGMSVLREYWGNGIGSLLIETLINWAADNGITRISLRVDEDNERGIRLYEKFGFQQEGILKNKKRLADGTYRNEYVMAKLIASGISGKEISQ
ncbi:MAG: GNAT family N-acetyltransferase [Halanaerobiaceae bacterium]